MFESTRRNVSLIGAGVVLTLGLAGGAAAGVVPKIGDAVDTASPKAAVSTPDGLAPAVVAEVPAVETPPPTEPPTTVVAVTSPPTTRPGAAARRSASASPAPAAAAPVASAAPAAPTIAARRNPTSAEIRSAISQLGLPIVPSEAQARQFGDSVCDAFDQGQTFAQVSATARQAANQVPLVSVSPAVVDSSVRTAVRLFCPDYSSKI